MRRRLRSAELIAFKSPIYVGRLHPVHQVGTSQRDQPTPPCAPVVHLMFPKGTARTQRQGRPADHWTTRTSPHHDGPLRPVCLRGYGCFAFAIRGDRVLELELVATIINAQVLARSRATVLPAMEQRGNFLSRSSSVDVGLKEHVGLVSLVGHDLGLASPAFEVIYGSFACSHGGHAASFRGVASQRATCSRS